MEWFLYIGQFVSEGPLFDWLSGLLQAEVTKMTIAFMIASEIHSRKVKKEFALLRESIEHVAGVTDKRFRSFEDRLTAMENREKR